eukprot:sb/3463805/
MDEEAIQQLYSWIDEITLSRPKRNITRDFSDGVLAAEIVGHFLPDLVEIHNYTPANSSQQKRTNWETLNRKVFKRIDFNVPSNIVSGIVMCKPGVIEIVLYNLRVKILQFKKNTEGDSEFSDAVTDPEPWSGNTGNPAVAVPVVPPQYYNPGCLSKRKVTLSKRKVVYPKESTFLTDKKGPLIQKKGHLIQKKGGLSKRKVVYPKEMWFIQKKCCVIAQPGGYPAATQPYHQPFPPQFQQPQQSQKQEGYAAQYSGHNNGTSGLATIPFEGEKVKKKTPKKKTAKGQGNAQNIAGAERSRSMPNSFAHLDHESRIFLQEKEQQLMQSQEVIQILQSKISRLEHLLQLKDLRIEDLSMKLQTMGGGAPRESYVNYPPHKLSCISCLRSEGNGMVRMKLTWYQCKYGEYGEMRHAQYPNLIRTSVARLYNCKLSVKPRYARPDHIGRIAPLYNRQESMDYLVNWIMAWGTNETSMDIGQSRGGAFNEAGLYEEDPPLTIQTRFLAKICSIQPVLLPPGLLLAGCPSIL